MKEIKYTLENYDKKSTFAGFLPGIAGVHGIPIWCYYVNRGQAITSFGIGDKDHSIMEFFPAHQAFQNTQKLGFRTFLRCNNKYVELYTNEADTRKMHIQMNSLTLEEWNGETGLHSKVHYFVLPTERVGALVRQLVITNEGTDNLEVEVIDGMPVVIPYGVGLSSVKEMGQTSKAWMQVEDLEKGIPYYRVRASMGDTACVTAIEGGNFSCGWDEFGNRLQAIVDPELVFGYDTSLSTAIEFRDEGLERLLLKEQITMNQYPCSFYATKKTLCPGESITIWQMIGQVESKKQLETFLNRNFDSTYFELKKEESEILAEDLCKVIETKTGSPEFDAYGTYTYMDNVLRGGYPITIGKDKIFYVYSRKHGDIERDYNYFKMLPEFYSQGNGNFRDVNQNRRSDIFFTPHVGIDSIKKFYNLIQLDGYNPLSIEKVTYTLDLPKVSTVFKSLNQKEKDHLTVFFKEPFTPGDFFKELEKLDITDQMQGEAYFKMVMDQAESTDNANFSEGYWSDHWTYNLDLVESYLSIYPDKEKELLYGRDFTWYQQQAQILPRKKRYVKTENGIRQYHFLNHQEEQKTGKQIVFSNYGSGEMVKSSLIEKCILLCGVKYAALDAYGMGVEMEGGKPGWYDALNGLPGIFGSSMAETYELARLLSFTIQILDQYPEEIILLEEIYDFVMNMNEATEQYSEDIESQFLLMGFWNLRNERKEQYWDKIFHGISGGTTRVNSVSLADILRKMERVVWHGIDKATNMTEGVCPTYFTYEATNYKELEDGIEIKEFRVQKIPLFLEGPVRMMKLNLSTNDKKDLYKNVLTSDLYDKKLQMYKVNASLESASYELGRAKAFTPGWLENESIWLHMEYKYLLELLKSGLYHEYAKDFHKAAIPFLAPEKYGRSIYENSSFIASSSNPNKAYHGRGFVARLSGSTAEFLQMWIMMMFGKLFTYTNGELSISFCPTLPQYLIGEDKRVEAIFMGTTKVRYELQSKEDYFPGEYEIHSMELIYYDETNILLTGNCILGQNARELRDGKIKEINVKIKK